MRPPIDGGTALITGACGPVGRELARQLARRCRTLVLVARQLDQLEKLRAELHERNPTLGLVLEPCDISKPHEVDAMLKSLASHLVQIDILVNAEAQAEQGLYEQAGWGRVEQVLQVNLVAPLLLTHRLLGPMIARKRGGVLNLGSGAGQLYLPGSAVAAASRRFLDGFTESLRLEVEGTGVVVTHVAPGPVLDTEQGPLASEDGSPLPLFCISARQCAREGLEGFERAAPLVYPGLGHRWVMRLLPLLPRAVKRELGRLAARGLRDTALLGPPHPDEQRSRRILLAGEPSPV